MEKIVFGLNVLEAYVFLTILALFYADYFE